MKSARGRLAQLASLALCASACSSSTPAPLGADDSRPPPDSPLVALQPGAWFDGEGNLSVVSSGRRLRLVLSAPIAACAAAFDGASRGRELAQKASLPFRVLADACRQDHPSILLPEEAEAASPSELERSYHDVSRCAGLELSARVAWIPNVVAEADPCPLALGLGWRLPNATEIEGLAVDERKAIAGALFDMDDRGGFGGLLLYARDPAGDLRLATLSPNASERAPLLDTEQRAKPFAAAALRCVRESHPAPGARRPTPPPLPEAAACLQALRAERAALAQAPVATLPELEQLEAWLKRLAQTPTLLHGEAGQRELLQLLNAPSLETLAREAREERALTERYAELAESLDDPAVSPGERERRRTEFESLRKRLSGQIARSAIAAGAHRRQLTAILARLDVLLQELEAARKSAKKGKAGPADPAALRRRVRELQGEPAAKTRPDPAAKR